MMKQSEFEAQQKAPPKGRVSLTQAVVLGGWASFYALAFLSLWNVWPDAIWLAFALPWLGLLFLKLKGQRK